MTITIILLVSHAVCFIAGALVFRKNAAKITNAEQALRK